MNPPKFQMLCRDDEAVFAYARQNDDHRLLVICNFFDKPVVNPLDKPAESSKLLICNYRDTDWSTTLRPFEARMYLEDRGR